MEAAIGLIDYGMGNLHSVQKAFDRLGRPLRIIKGPEQAEECFALILPGVGAYDPAINQLKESGFIPVLQEWGETNRPILGICLGLQLLFESSEEGSAKGLGIFKGHIKKLPTNQGERIPHMGWSQISKRKECPLLHNELDKEWMYFVHSYFAVPKAKSDLAATARFGSKDVTAIIWEGRIGACQFHPEKSSNSGQMMLLRWIKWLESGALSIR